ncbi:MAG: AMP-binding protein [Deltaproteobacteria bacterium]|nr:AMP-binding protein [Deltaproteobacteria bacterium]MBL7216858.1 AMP-binding protein [Desulfobacteraceae bacterium]
MAQDTVPKLFFHRVEKYKDRVALRKKELGLWNKITWWQYGQRVRQVGMGLVLLGLEPKDRVAIIGDSRPEWLYVDIGNLSVNGVSVGVYTTSSPEEVKYHLSHSETRFFFVEDEEQLDKALEIRDQLPKLEKVIVMDMKGLKHFHDPMVISFEELLQAGKEFDERNPGLFEQRLEKTGPDDIATFVYTSGTTGPPKAVMLSHSNVLSNSDAFAKHVAAFETDVILSYLPLCHIAERTLSVYHAINIGFTVFFAESPNTVPDNLREMSPTFFFAVPRIWEKFYSAINLGVQNATWFKRQSYNQAIKIGKRAAQKRLNHRRVPFFLWALNQLASIIVFRKVKKLLGIDRSRFALSGAAPISPDVLEYFHALGVNIRESYGMTESSALVTMHKDRNIRLGTCGEPLPGIEVKIAEDGEILIRGDNVFQGYFKDEENTSRTLIDGWLHSEDLGEFTDDGLLRITGRKKDLIITSGGKNISPQFIENLLKFSPYIVDAVVIGDGRKYLTAIIIVDEDNVIQYAQENGVPFTTYASLTKTKEILKLIGDEVKEVNAKLARVEQIKKFAITEKILDQEDDELTPTMKVKRKKISEVYKDLIESMY